MKGTKLLCGVVVASGLAVAVTEPPTFASVTSSEASRIYGSQCGALAANNNWCTPDWWGGNAPCGVSKQPADYVAGTGSSSAAAPCSTIPSCTDAYAVVGCGGT